MTKKVGPVSANRAAETLRALYKHAAKLNRALPPVIPTSGVTFNVEQPKQVSLRFDQFPGMGEGIRRNQVAEAPRIPSVLAC